MTNAGVSSDMAMVSDDNLFEGFDTIFVMTDGDSNQDSYTGHAPYVSGPPGFAGGVLYAQTSNILRAVERMNLFRRAEIHCIGMGSSPRDLLTQLAALGHGRARFLGY